MLAITAILCQLLAISPNPQTAFYTLALAEGRIHIVRYEYSQPGTFKQTFDTTLPLGQLQGPVNHTIEYAELSPGNRWLAVGTSNTSGERVLTIFDTAKWKLVFQKREEHWANGQWFTWKSRQELRLFREVSEPIYKDRKYDIIALMGPDWEQSERVISQSPNGYSEILGRQAQEREARISEATRLLKRLNYYPASEVVPGGSPSPDWERYFRVGATATVSDNGKMIAVLASKHKGPDSKPTEVEHGPALVLLREGNGWREEKLLKPNSLRFMQFWKDWLVIGDGTLQVVTGQGRNSPSLSTFTNNRITVYPLNNLSRPFQVKATFFAPAR